MLKAVIVLVLASLVATEHNEEVHQNFLKMPKDEFVEYFNSLNFSFKISRNEYLANMEPCHIIDSNISLPIVKHNPKIYAQLQGNFDARAQWPQCSSISTIYDQGQCGSCWTFGAANTASDRTCILSNMNVQLANQDAECSVSTHTNMCKGGDPQRLLQHWVSNGLVTMPCKSYNPQLMRESNCRTTCDNPGLDYNQDKHYGQDVYQVNSNVDDIKAEISTRGTVEATLAVFNDFTSFIGDGVYEHTYGDSTGYHSLRIIGYGVQDGKDYWLVANSWGTSWGNNGVGKIKMNQAEIGLESKIIGVTPRG